MLILAALLLLSTQILALGWAMIVTALSLLAMGIRHALSTELKKLGSKMTREEDQLKPKVGAEGGQVKRI